MRDFVSFCLRESPVEVSLSSTFASLLPICPSSASPLKIWQRQSGSKAHLKCPFPFYAISFSATKARFRRTALVQVWRNRKIGKKKRTQSAYDHWVFIVVFRPHRRRFTAADSAAEDIWEYETVRRRSVYAEQRIDNAATLRPAVSATLPSSLRHLFEDETGHDSPMTLKPSTANTSGFLNAPMPAMTLPQLDPTDNLPAMEPPGQGFKRSSPVPVDPIVQMEIQPDPYRDVTPPLDAESEHKMVPIVKPSPPTINIDFTPASDVLDQSKQLSSPVIRPPGASAPSPRPPVTVTRKRSQSNADTSARSRLALNLDLTPDLDLASPASFQFPLPRRGSPAPSTTLPPQQQQQQQHLPEYHGTITSTPVSGPTGHQMTHSLDASPKAAAHRRLSPGGLGGLGPPHLLLSRTRSATVLPEGVGGTEGLVRTGFPFPAPPPKRPVEDAWLRVGNKPLMGTEKERNVPRNNSDSSLDLPNTSTPGLRDVLKVGFDHDFLPSIMLRIDFLILQIPTLTPEHHLGIAGLLPPSPSAAMHSPKQFNPPPASPGLGVMADYDANDSASPIGPVLRILESQSPTSLDVQTATTTTTGPEGIPSPALDPSEKPPADPSSNPAFLRHLAYGDLVHSPDLTHAELERTVNHLAEWLSTVEIGLSGILDEGDGDTIEEEGEDSLTDNQSDVVEPYFEFGSFDHDP